jgi:hypothetical protein
MSGNAARPSAAKDALADERDQDFRQDYGREDGRQKAFRERLDAWS